MKNGDIALIDCGHGVIRLKAYMTISGLGFQIQAFKPSWTEDGKTEPPESCMFTINGDQARQIADSLIEVKPDEYKDALRELVKQISIGTIIDAEGHDANMLFAYNRAQALLGSQSIKDAKQQ